MDWKAVITILLKAPICAQSCIMSIFLHGAKFSNQILPQEKCVIRNNFGVFSELSLLKRCQHQHQHQEQSCVMSIFYKEQNFQTKFYPKKNA